MPPTITTNPESADSFEDRNRADNWITSAEALRRATERLFAARQDGFKAFRVACAGPAAIARIQSGDTTPPFDFVARLMDHATDLPPLYLMAGYALEVIAKALAIKLEPHRIKGGKINFGKAHDTLGLLSDIGFPLSSSDTELCSCLQRMVRDVGRYPTANNANNSFSGWAVDEDRDIPHFLDLYSRIKTQAER